ncbi:MAG: hypothetical protein AUK31_09755 [Fibrobacteres bacterium CG2_30_45_31]|nr:MAG: hypothetical protein AUK31_09755 [Fibrobacteres bacterium CG2_30_45_31]
MLFLLKICRVIEIKKSFLLIKQRFSTSKNKGLVYSYPDDFLFSSYITICISLPLQAFSYFIYWKKWAISLAFDIGFVAEYFLISFLYCFCHFADFSSRGNQ